MNSRERVLTALRREEPDRVPYCELGVDPALARQLLGRQDLARQAGGTTGQRMNLETNAYTVAEVQAIADELLLDNISYVLRAPVYTEKVAGMDGRLFYGDGLIRSRDDLSMLDLPDPYDDGLYEEAAAFAANKGERAAFFVTRIGVFPTMLSMGMEAFSVALYDDLPLIQELLDRYCSWQAVVAERVCQLGFDVFVSTDDMAFNSAPFFPPQVFHDLIMPGFRQAAEHITLPWVIHSDGNVIPLLDDLMTLGIVGIHPLEKGAVDIVSMKRDYGDRLCLLGNVDLNLLGMGPPEAVDLEVKGLIRDVAPGGGYIVTSGNSLAGYLLPDNVRALSGAVQRYGRYPIAVD